MNYSICFLDDLGRTLRSEFDAFDSDDAAVTYGRAGVPDTDIVEVWKGEHLLARLFRDQSNLPDYILKKPLTGRTLLAHWENEGGATFGGDESAAYAE